MSPVTIHCVRHAQGFHNLSVANHAMHDPMLTPLGEEQCKTLQQNFPFMKQVDGVVASPLRRTMYTALLSFAPAIQDKHLHVMALPELQETSDLPCDTGSDVPELERQFKGQPVDLSYMYTPAAKYWNSKEDKWAPSASAIEDRARLAREWLHSRPEKEIVVVTHGGFLHYFTQDWRDTHRMDGTPSAGKSHRSRRHSESSRSTIISPYPPGTSQAEPRSRSMQPREHHHHHRHQHHHHNLTSSDPTHHHHHHHLTYSYLFAGTGWANTEYRSYIFDTASRDFALIETPESRKKRAGDDKPLSKEEAKNLQRTQQPAKA